VDFAKLLQDAVDLLEGDSGAFADADEQRDRLLQGYEYIFVDEYQDINEQQYALVSALVGRRHHVVFRPRALVPPAKRSQESPAPWSPEACSVAWPHL
jgi:ATP-dependent exoDNAse (exonuclease V) beta subunit